MLAARRQRTRSAACARQQGSLKLDRSTRGARAVESDQQMQIAQVRRNEKRRCTVELALQRIGIAWAVFRFQLKVLGWRAAFSVANGQVRRHAKIECGLADDGGSVHDSSRR